MPQIRNPSRRVVDARPKSPTPLPATQIGSWRLQRLIHAGPWSHVYQVRPNTCPDNQPADYALKLAVADNDERLSIAMLQRHAWLARELASEHLAPVLDVHADRPPFYLVMPFLQGVSLRQLLGDGPLPIPFALWIARQLAMALAVIHDHGWRHGDVKPENVHVADDGHATLLDFGFASPLEPGRCSGIELSAMFQGTLSYAPPEMLAEADDVSPISSACDVYSLGVVLYEMLVGRPPFEHAEADALAAAIRFQAPTPLRRRRPEVPITVSELSTRMISRQPLRRPTASETADLLAELEIESFAAWA